MHALPHPAALAPLPRLPPQLARCLLLALLLHVWLVLLLGNAPGGTARPGEGVGGAINITLRGPEAPGAAAMVPPAPPAVPTGPSGSGTLPRWGGAVRDIEPLAPLDPGAAQLGAWAARPALAPPLPATPPLEPGRVLEERLVPVPPPPPVPATPSAAPEPAATERMLASPLGRAATPSSEIKPLETLAPAAVRSVAAPALPELAPPVITPAPAPPAPVAEAPLRQLSAPVPAATPALAPLPQTAPLATTPLPALQPLPALGTGLPASVPTAVPSATPGAPDAGSRVGADVANPPAAAASAPPRLNLELARPRGGELSRYGTPGVLPLLPRPPELADKLARDIEKAAKADCRKAHSGLGLLAVVPLALDAARKDGCKW